MMESGPTNPKVGFRIKDDGSKGVAHIPPKIGGGGEKERRPEKHHKLALKVAPIPSKIGGGGEKNSRPEKHHKPTHFSITGGDHTKITKM